MDDSIQIIKIDKDWSPKDLIVQTENCDRVFLDCTSYLPEFYDLCQFVKATNAKRIGILGGRHFSFDYACHASCVAYESGRELQGAIVEKKLWAWIRQ